MWHRVDVVLIDVSEECIASIFSVERKITAVFVFFEFVLHLGD
jgi:hypothetical protein